MNNSYTLDERYFFSFLKEKQLLFENKIKGIIEDINLKELYNYILDLINNSEDESIETLYGGDKAFKISAYEEYEEILIYSKECNEEDILELLSLEDKVYSIKIIERICHRNLSIHFDENVNNIVFSYRFIDEHKYILMRNYKILVDKLNDYDYVLWLLSVIGDFLFEFEE